MDWLKGKSPITQLVAIAIMLILVLIIVNLVLGIVKALLPLAILVAVAFGIYWLVVEYNKE
jgi:hypothetical protein